MARLSEQLDDTFVALADPTRRAILRRLTKGQARVTELAAPFSISLNSVSKHIKILERAGLVERSKIGRDHLIRFCPQALRRAQSWIDQQEAFWQASLKSLDELLQRKEEGHQ